MERYRKFSAYLKARFGCRVHKVSVDAGLACPNQDGAKSKEGCIFCDNKAFSFQTRAADGSLKKDLKEQIQEGMTYGRTRYKAEKFIVYFQSFTNTYADPVTLKDRYGTIKEFQDIVGLAIGTRPDCVSAEIISLLQEYTSRYEVWLEYGLQSIHEKTLILINRNHTYQDFLNAWELTRNRNIRICAHVILGLPGETREEMLETAKECGRLQLDGIKIHPLHVVKGTKLEELYRRGQYRPMELEEYVSTCVEFLQYLHPATVIQRLSADCPEEFLVAPDWLHPKNSVVRMIEETLVEGNTCQAARYAGA